MKPKTEKLSSDLMTRRPNLPTDSTNARLVLFGITFLLASPSQVDAIKDSTDSVIRTFLARANINGPLQDAALSLIQAIANDPVIRTQMIALHDSLLNRTSTATLYTQPICPNDSDSIEILQQLVVAP